MRFAVSTFLLFFGLSSHAAEKCTSEDAPSAYAVAKLQITSYLSVHAPQVKEFQLAPQGHLIGADQIAFSFISSDGKPKIGFIWFAFCNDPEGMLYITHGDSEEVKIP